MPAHIKNKILPRRHAIRVGLMRWRASIIHEAPLPTVALLLIWAVLAATAATWLLVPLAWRLPAALGAASGSLLFVICGSGLAPNVLIGILRRAEAASDSLFDQALREERSLLAGAEARALEAALSSSQPPRGTARRL
jgi:hypothetical protein